MTLTELLFASAMLTGVALATAYFVTQTRVSMSLSSQSTECQNITQQALNRVTALGNRIYGYRISNTDLGYNPLLIKKGTPIASTNPPEYSILDVGSVGTTTIATEFPMPDLYKDLYKELMGVSPPTTPHWINTEVPLVTYRNNRVENGTALLLLNSVNFLQYLYNSDVLFFTGNPDPEITPVPVSPNEHRNKMGKEIDISQGSGNDITAVLRGYKDRSNLKNMKYYIKVTPVSLAAMSGTTTGGNTFNVKANQLIEGYKHIYCQETSFDGSNFQNTWIDCPKRGSSHKLIFTRPYLSEPQTSQLQQRMTFSNAAHRPVLKGTPYIGFQIKVRINYEQGTQKFSCEGSRIFSQQMKMLTGQQRQRINVTLDSLENGGGENLLASGNRKQTSCDGDTDYKDVTAVLNFNGFGRTGSGNPSEEVGTFLLCKGVVGCVSGDDESSSYNANGISCSPNEGSWQRCHEVKFPGQSGATDATLLANDRLKLKFNDLPENRRYDLYIAEMSSLELSEKHRIARFYIDGQRPTVSGQKISDNESDVGVPRDGGTGSRNYTGPSTTWVPPPGSGTKWLQCNRGDVNFTSSVSDQFTHNFEDCEIGGTRRDGVSTSTDISSNITADSNNDSTTCAGTLTGIAHGRQTINIKTKDICGDGNSVSGPVWDTDLPSTFVPQEFSSPNPRWFTSGASRPTYTINTVVPATGLGTFPKHYSVKCEDNQYGTSTRTDGNGGTIACNLTRDNSTDHNGCNPQAAGADYLHVCGGSSQHKSIQWAVFAPLGESCANVQCETQLICCSHHANKSCTTNRCYRQINNPRCTNPKGGSNQDSESNCSDLGLYDCTYNLPCNGTRVGTDPFYKTGPSSRCLGKRQHGSNNTCSFPVSGTCTPNVGTGWKSYPIPTGAREGTCRFSGTTYTKSCTAGQVQTQCLQYQYKNTQSNCYKYETGRCTGKCSVDDSSCTGTTCTRNRRVSGQCTRKKCSIDDSRCSSTTCRRYQTGRCINNRCNVDGSSCTGNGSCRGIRTGRCEGKCSVGDASCTSSTCTGTRRVSGQCTRKTCSVGGASCSGNTCSRTQRGTCTPRNTSWQRTRPSRINAGNCSIDNSSCNTSQTSDCVSNSRQYQVPSNSCSVNVSGTCGTPSGRCTRKGRGGGNLSVDQCSVRNPTGTCNSNTTCCDGDTYPSNTRCLFNGQCDNTVKYGCTPKPVGSATGSVATNKVRKTIDGIVYDTWDCPGGNGGTTDTGCKRQPCTGDGEYADEQTCETGFDGECQLKPDPNPDQCWIRPGCTPGDGEYADQTTCEDGMSDGQCCKEKTNQCWERSTECTCTEPEDDEYATSAECTSSDDLPEHGHECKSQDNGCFKIECFNNGHWQETEEKGGKCLPSCGEAARIVGSGGYGPDNTRGTNDDPHINSQTACEDVTRYGFTEWKDITFDNSGTLIDSYNDIVHCCDRPTKCTCNTSEEDGCGNDCVASQTPDDTTTHFQWTCTRANYEDSEICQKEKGCVEANNEYISLSACQGGDTSQACRQKENECFERYTPESCTCNTSEENGCGNDCVASQTPDDTGTHLQWTCTRANYEDSGTCQKRRPIDGECGDQPYCSANTVIGSCVTGEPGSVSCGEGPDDNGGGGPGEPATQLCTWICRGLYGGNNDTCPPYLFTTCSDLPHESEPNYNEPGRCDNTQKYGCENGNPNKDAYPDTNTTYRWRCDAQAGNSSMCSKQK